MPLVEERLVPDYQASLVVGDDPTSAIELRRIDRLALTPSPVDLSANSTLDYVRRNPGALTVLLGKQTDRALHQSALGAMTSDETLLKVWRRLRERARRSMRKGAWVENTQTGARTRNENYYCTAEAKRLADSGVVLLSTQWVRYEPD